MFGKPVKKPDEKTARDVYGEGPERERPGKMCTDKFCRKKAADPAEKAAEANQKNRMDHALNLKMFGVSQKMETKNFVFLGFQK